MTLISCGECGREISDKATACPGCGAPAIKDKGKTSHNFEFDPDIGKKVIDINAENSAPKPEEDKVGSKIKTTSEFAGSGCLVQAVGLVALVFWPIGTIIGVILFILGSRMSIKYLCGNCGNKIENKSVKICPSCQSTFD